MGVRDGRAISPLAAPPERLGRSRTGDPRRGEGGRGPRLFPPRRAVDQPRRAGSPPSRWTPAAPSASRCKIRDLATGEDIETVSSVVNGAVVWSAGSDAVAYTEVNDNWRTFRARLHRLGTDPESDPTLYEEVDDIGFNVHVGRTQDRQWIVVGTNDHETSEVRLRPRRRSAGPIAADRAAQGEAPVQRRFGARHALDPHQRRSHQFPARLRRSPRRPANGRR